MRRAFDLARRLAAPVHDRRRAGAAILGDGAADDENDGGPVCMAMPGDDATRLNDEPPQKQPMLLAHYVLALEIEAGQHLVGDALGLGWIHLLALAIGDDLVGGAGAGRRGK